MKIKNLIAVAALLLGSTTVFAQRNVGEQFPQGNYIYEVTKVMGSKPGELKIIAIRDGKDPVVKDSLKFVGYLETKVFEDTYKFNVTYAETNALQQTGTTNGTILTITGAPTTMTSAKKVVIPKEFTMIKTDCFKGYTNITEISFEDGSVVSDIQDNAFTTTQISKFDFTPCSKLAALNDEVFVEAGKINSYITEIILPANSKLLKNIEAAFMNLPNLENITNLEKSSITKVVANAFKNDAKLTKIELPATVKEIQTDAFKGSGISDLTINVDGLVTSEGGIEANVYGATVPVSTLTKLTLKGELGAKIATNAFQGCDKLATLDMSNLTIISGGQIATDAFKDCVMIPSVTIKAINDTPWTTPGDPYTINNQAFNGCTALTTVNIGSINTKCAIGAKAFGIDLTSVTIGTVKAGGEAIAGSAFKFADESGIKLNIAQGTGEYLSSDDAATPIFAASAFDFSAVVNAGASATFVMPAVKIGEILSKGGVFAGADIKVGATLSELTFTGNIASDGIDAFILSSVGAINKITFNGTIETGGIAQNAFAGLTPVMTLEFNGELKEKAVAKGAFEGLPATSEIYYNATTITDATVNPFDQEAFKAGALKTNARIIKLMAVKNAALKAEFDDEVTGIEGTSATGAFDIFLVKWDDTPIVITPDWTFFAYKDKLNDKNVAWARCEFGATALNSTVQPGKDLKIQRVQAKYMKKDGTEVTGDIKVTIYGTYTDEDDNNNKSTIYMVPLKSIGGYYYIPGNNAETLIAKVELKSGEFAADTVKIAVSNVAGPSSIWTGLTNTELFVASNMMTNQQLFDKTAVDAATDIVAMKGSGTDAQGDYLLSTITLGASGAFHAARNCSGIGGVNIYRSTTATSDNAKIAEDLYVMRNPAAGEGFGIHKRKIEKGGAYINAGWYYMLLKKYSSQATFPANVVWMDDASDSEITGILEVKDNVQKVQNNAIYTLQGVRVSATQKGMIYIQNGKKFIAK